MHGMDWVSVFGKDEKGPKKEEWKRINAEGDFKRISPLGRRNF
jgi:hypothetical protein